MCTVCIRHKHTFVTAVVVLVVLPHSVTNHLCITQLLFVLRVVIYDHNHLEIYRCNCDVTGTTIAYEQRVVYGLLCVTAQLELYLSYKLPFFQPVYSVQLPPC
jgi:hypothetical protein